MLCRRYNAAQMLEWGLVNAVVPKEALDAEVARWCEELLEMSPTALKTIKHSFGRIVDRTSIRDVVEAVAPVLLPDRRTEGRCHRVPRKAQTRFLGLGAKRPNGRQSIPPGCDRPYPRPEAGPSVPAVSTSRNGAAMQSLSEAENHPFPERNGRAETLLDDFLRLARDTPERPALVSYFSDKREPVRLTYGRHGHARRPARVQAPRIRRPARRLRLLSVPQQMGVRDRPSRDDPRRRNFEPDHADLWQTGNPLHARANEESRLYRAEDLPAYRRRARCSKRSDRNWTIWSICC